MVMWSASRVVMKREPPGGGLVSVNWLEPHQRVDAGLHVNALLLRGDIFEVRHEGQDEVDLGAEADLREWRVLLHGPVLLQLKVRDAVDIVIRDLKHLVGEPNVS